MGVVAAVPVQLLDLARRTEGPDLAALAAGRATPRHAAAVAAHVRRARHLALAAAATGTALLLAGGAPALAALALAARSVPLRPAAAAGLLAATLGLPLDGDGRVHRTRADPQAVAWLAATIGTAALLAVARRHPHLVGPVDGIPPRVRDLANRRLAREAAARLEARGERRRAEELRSLARSPGLLLLVDPDAGRAAQVVGDLATARHVAVLVPGMGHDLGSFGAVRAHAAAVREAARELGEDVAVVAWLGYDSPSGLQEAVLDDAARAGADQLARLVAALPAAATRTVVAHSYGSVVAGEAARHGLAADAVVVAGSPGVGRWPAGGPRLYALRAPGDAVAVSGWHGPDPASREGGATRLRTGRARGHSAYFRPGTESLRNVALVASGRAREATVDRPTGTAPAERVADAAERAATVPRDARLDAAQAAGRAAGAALSSAADWAEARLPAPVAGVVDRAQGAVGRAAEVADRGIDALQRLAPSTLVDAARDLLR